MLESIKMAKSHYTTQNLKSTFKRITQHDSKKKNLKSTFKRITQHDSKKKI